MLKSIGALHNIPAPSAAVLGESLKLLATFGDKKGISPVLEQMREVQAQNEQVFREAQAVMGELFAMQKELDNSRVAYLTAKVNEDLAAKQRASALSQAEARLSGKEAKFTEEQESALNEVDERESGVADRERRVTERELNCQVKEDGLVSRAYVLDHKDSDMRVHEQQLQAKEKKLRAALEG